MGKRTNHVPIFTTEHWHIHVLYFCVEQIERV